MFPHRFPRVVALSVVLLLAACAAAPAPGPAATAASAPAAVPAPVPPVAAQRPRAIDPRPARATTSTTGCATTRARARLFHVDMEAGHGGKSGRFRRYREIAMEYAFLPDRLGIPVAPAGDDFETRGAAAGAAHDE